MEFLSDPGPFTRRGTSLVLFSAAWCGPCRKVKETIRQSDTTLPVGVVDIDESPAIAQKFGIMSVPTLIVFEDGQPVDQYRGSIPFNSIVRKYS